MAYVLERDIPGWYIAVHPRREQKKKERKRKKKNPSGSKGSLNYGVEGVTAVPPSTRATATVPGPSGSQALIASLRWDASAPTLRKYI